MKILIIDDELVYIELFLNVMKQFGQSFIDLQILSATNLKEADEILLKNSIDIIFLDLYLKENDIDEVFEKISDLKNKATIIGISNTEQRDLIIKTMKKGAANFIGKDMLSQPQELIKIINETLDSVKNIPDSRKIIIDKEIVDLAKRKMTDEDLEKLLEFAYEAKYTIDRIAKIEVLTDKVYTALFDSNISPSIKNQIETLKKDIEGLSSTLEKITSEEEEEEKISSSEKWKTWGIIAPLILALITGLGKFIWAIFFPT